MKRFSRKIGVSKKFALKASLYRRLAKRHTIQSKVWTYTKDDLIELFDFESTGETTRRFDEMKTNNGFALGKWLRDIDCASYLEGIAQGDFCKAEFLGTAIERIHNSEMLGHVIVPPWFPYMKENRSVLSLRGKSNGLKSRG